MKQRAWVLIVVCSALLGADGADEQRAKPNVGMALRFELFVRDVSASAKFYEDVLHFAVARKSPDYAVAESGAVQIGLQGDAGVSKTHYFYPELAAGRRGVGVEIVLEVDDVGATFEDVKKKGHPIQSPLKRRPWGATDFRIADPDGYYLRITSR